MKIFCKIFPPPNFVKVYNSKDTLRRYTTVYCGKSKTVTCFGYTKTAIFRPYVSYMQKKEIIYLQLYIRCKNTKAEICPLHEVFSNVTSV